jgi:hypothetical protein
MHDIVRQRNAGADGERNWAMESGHQVLIVMNWFIKANEAVDRYSNRQFRNHGMVTWGTQQAGCCHNCFLLGECKFANFKSWTFSLVKYAFLRGCTPLFPRQFGFESIFASSLISST